MFMIFEMLSLAVLSQPVTVRPAPDPSSFANPLRGWVSWWENHEEPRQPGSLVFAYQRWSETEKAQAVYDFKAWDQKNLDFWIKRGFHIILRLELDYPRPKAEADLPAYILDHGNKGTWYDKKEIGKGYSPDYDDPFLLENLERFLAAFGAHYGVLESVAVIQYGVIGHWGEWHTWPDGSGKLPSEASMDRIVIALKKAFPRKYLQIRYHNKSSADDPHVGFHDDCWGELTSCLDGTWCTQYNLNLFNLKDRWKTAPNGGEFCNPKQYLFGAEKDFQKAFSDVENLHASWLGPQAVGDTDPGGPYQARLDLMEKKLGYRFVVEEAVFNEQGEEGKPWVIRLRIRNEGSAPFYFGWKPELSLLDPSGAVVWNGFLNSDPLTWLPGRVIEVTETLSLPLSPSPSLPRFSVALCLRDPSSTRRARFANVPVDSSGKLILGMVSFH